MANAQWPKGTHTESFGFLTQVLARHVEAAMKERLDSLDLEFRFFTTLMQLLAEDGQSQRVLGARLNLPEYQVSRNLDAMAKQGLVERRPDAENRRVMQVFLTDEGRALANRLPPMINELNAELLSSLSRTEQKTLISMLQRVLALTD